MTIFKSRKFWLMIADVVVSLSTYFISKYVNPEAAKDVLFVISILQPVVIAVIIGIAVEDAATKSAVGSTTMNITGGSEVVSKTSTTVSSK